MFIRFYWVPRKTIFILFIYLLQVILYTVFRDNELKTEKRGHGTYTDGDTVR